MFPPNVHSQYSRYERIIESPVMDLHYNLQIILLYYDIVLYMYMTNKT